MLRDRDGYEARAIRMAFHAVRDYDPTSRAVIDCMVQFALMVIPFLEAERLADHEATTDPLDGLRVSINLSAADADFSNFNVGSDVVRFITPTQSIYKFYLGPYAFQPLELRRVNGRIEHDAHKP